MADVLGNVETKANSILVELFLVLQESKELEELLLIFLRDSNTGVYHFDHQNWAIF
jgi:hypothetical protein